MKVGRTSEQVVLIIETELVEVPVGMFKSGGDLEWTLDTIVLLRLVLSVSKTRLNRESTSGKCPSTESLICIVFQLAAMTSYS